MVKVLAVRLVLMASGPFTGSFILLGVEDCHNRELYAIEIAELTRTRRTKKSLDEDGADYSVCRSSELLTFGGLGDTL